MNSPSLYLIIQQHTASRGCIVLWSIDAGDIGYVFISVLVWWISCRMIVEHTEGGKAFDHLSLFVWGTLTETLRSLNTGCFWTLVANKRYAHIAVDFSYNNSFEYNNKTTCQKMLKNIIHPDWNKLARSLDCMLNHLERSDFLSSARGSVWLWRLIQECAGFVLSVIREGPSYWKDKQSVSIWFFTFWLIMLPKYRFLWRWAKHNGWPIIPVSQQCI